MKTASFQVGVTAADATRFAELSGDWNPLHTDVGYAAKTAYGRPILHGAFSAGLISRMAGMHIPGRDCLLHSMRLRFVSPIFVPAQLSVSGSIVREADNAGMVEVRIDDAERATRYVEGSYEFGRHQTGRAGDTDDLLGEAQDLTPSPPILVTGATGGLGQALLRRLGSRALGVSRKAQSENVLPADSERLAEVLSDGQIAGIVHCGWPAPNNQQLTALGVATASAVRYHVTDPLTQMIQLAQLLAKHGTKAAPLILVGSSFADLTRHSIRSPLYSLAKSLVPSLTKFLAVELGATGQRCLSVVFDVIEGAGMNAAMTAATALSHADRSPFGSLAKADDAAAQIEWLLANPSMFLSGATISLSGGAIP